MTKMRAQRGLIKETGEDNISMSAVNEINKESEKKSFPSAFVQRKEPSYINTYAHLQEIIYLKRS